MAKFDSEAFVNCTRCGGTGHYSFNMMHGTVCYGCSGRGFKKDVLTKRDVKATSEDPNTCVVGDILLRGGVHYRVIGIRFFAGKDPGFGGFERVIAYRLVDGLQFKLERQTYVNGCASWDPENSGKVIAWATNEQIAAWKAQDAKHLRGEAARKHAEAQKETVNVNRDIFGMPKLNKANPCVIRWAYGFPTGDGWDHSSDMPWCKDLDQVDMVYQDYAQALTVVNEQALPELRKQHTGFGTWVEYVLIQDTKTGGCEFVYKAKHE